MPLKSDNIKYNQEDIEEMLAAALGYPVVIQNLDQYPRSSENVSFEVNDLIDAKASQAMVKFFGTDNIIYRAKRTPGRKQSDRPEGYIEVEARGCSTFPQRRITWNT